MRQRIAILIAIAGLAAAAEIPFEFYQEFYGPHAYTDPQIAQNLAEGMMNGVTFSPPVSAEMSDLDASGWMLRLPGSPGPATLAEPEIEHQLAAWNALAKAHPGRTYYWNLLPEWDQSGGAWVPDGRPRYDNLSRQAAHNRFVSSFAVNHPEAIRWLAQPREDHAFKLAAVTDYPSNVHTAYEMGVDLQLLERGIDELGDLPTGIAFLRGAARQHERAWGIDLSSWRTGNDRATEFDANGVLTGGWSASYLRRHYYSTYLNGANVLHNEAVNYRFPDGKLNPLGEATREFADFALQRHPGLGDPVATAALLLPQDQGFDPKHGAYNQQDAVWYQDLPYSDGDIMFDRLLREAYPDHGQHGLAPNAPFLNSSGLPDAKRFRAFLAAGNDPRSYEPMTSTRWGDNLDFITDRASGATLARYEVIVLVGEPHFSEALRTDLREWIRRGGELVMFGGQGTPDTIFEAQAQAETPNDYRLGSGVVHFATPKFGLSAEKTHLLPSTVALLDDVLLSRMPARIVGPPLEYVVNRLPGKVVVGLFNHASTEWTGQVVFNHADAIASVTEYVHDQPLAFEQTGLDVAVPVRIPAFDVRVIAIE